VVALIVDEQLLEVASAMGLLVPEYRFWAALQIAVIMATATSINIVIFHQLPLAWLRRTRTTLKAPTM
jgi:uncharacterized membrane protein